MNALLLAAALAAAPARAQDQGALMPAGSYGVLILAYDVDVKWRQELANLALRLKGHPVEVVDSADDSISVQRAVDKLLAQRVTKIVGVPIETVSESVRLQTTRYFFGLRAAPILDVPGPGGGDIANKPPPPIKPVRKPSLVLTGEGGGFMADDAALKPVKSPVPLGLAAALDKSPVLVAILADRAKALTPTPGQESLVLAGVGPRNDAALKDWLTEAQLIADLVGSKAGYRKATAVAVRDGVRADQQDRDRAGLRKTFQGLIRLGRVDVVPLSPEAERVDQLLRQTLGGFYAYRWTGQGIQGDRRLGDWIKESAEKTAALTEGRKDKGAAPGAILGGLP